MLHDVSRRTTLTLEDDVAADVQREARRSGRSVKAVVNSAIRAGLDRQARGPREPFRVKPFDMGLRPGLNLDDIEGLLDLIEGPHRR
jgi:hypothetical protein